VVDDPSQLLAGKYRLVQQLGRGGMGSVWRAEHVTLHAMVAIKLLDPVVAQTRDGLNRFLREAQAAAALRSPHIVQILDHGIDRGQPFIAMELLEGESLGTRLERVTRLSPAETARIVQQIGRAMTRAHDAGIIHRDLKPDNIFLVPNDDEEVVKVLDFGIAKTPAPLNMDVNESTRTGTMLGTPYYMSPEQVEQVSGADYRTDIWALGVIAYQCLLGKRPFDAETVGGLFVAICSKEIPVPSSRGMPPPGFDTWFARACARNPHDRFPTARDAATELRRICQDQPWSVGTELAPYPAGPSFANTTGQGAAVGVSTPAPSTVNRRAVGPSLAVAGIALVIGVGAWQVLRTKAEHADALPSTDSTSAPHSVTISAPSSLPPPAATDPPSSATTPSSTTASALEAPAPSASARKPDASPPRDTKKGVPPSAPQATPRAQPSPSAKLGVDLGL
jgi:serine/threonine protein kinase